LPPAYATKLSASPRTESSEIGRAGLHGSVTKSAEAAPMAAKTSAASQAKRCAKPAPFEMPVAYTRLAFPDYDTKQPAGRSQLAWAASSEPARGSWQPMAANLWAARRVRLRLRRDDLHAW
jgi:hypothetical protein